MAHGQGGAEVAFDHGPTLTCNHDAPLIAFDPNQITSKANRSTPRGDRLHTMPATAAAPLIAFSVRGREGGAQAEADDTGAAPALRAAEGGSTRPMVAQAFDWQSGGDARGLDPKETAQLQRCQVPALFAFDAYNQSVSDVAHTLRRGSGPAGDAVPQTIAGARVRRLTPRECERLQGFPDDWTAVPYRGKPASDGPRYKALGNSMAVNCMRWIGMRIAEVDAARRACR